MPSKLGKGSKTLHVASDGVRRFYRDRDLDLDARVDGLADSDDTGRVRLVENFSSENDGLISKLEEEKQKQIRDLEEKVQGKIKQIQNITL